MITVTARYERHEAFGYVVWRPVGISPVQSVLLRTVDLTNGRLQDAKYLPTHRFQALWVILPGGAAYVPLTSVRTYVEQGVL